MFLFKRLWQKAVHRRNDSFWVETQESGFSELAQEFEAVIADLQGPHVEVLRRQVKRSENPRDLWFLRERIFLMVAGQISEEAASQRIRRIDERMRHFVSHHRFEYRKDELPSQPANLVH